MKLSALRTSTRVAQGLSFFSPVVYCDGACVLFGEDGAFLPKQYRVHGISKHLKKSGNVPGDLVDRRVPSMHTKIIHHFLLLHSSYPPWHATVARNREAAPLHPWVCCGAREPRQTFPDSHGCSGAASPLHPWEGALGTETQAALGSLEGDDGIPSQRRGMHRIVRQKVRYFTNNA